MLSGIVMALLNPMIIIFNSALTPVLNIVATVFPDSVTHYNNFLAFLDVASTYFHCCLRWLLFTPGMFTLLFAYFLAKFYAWTFMTGARFMINLWNYLKP